MKVRCAVSLVIVAENYVYSIRRQNYLRSFPGYTAFPGGKVDECDYQETENGHLAALFREGREELNFNFDTDERVESIEYLATATSPAFNPARFETYFYKIFLFDYFLYIFY